MFSQLLVRTRKGEEDSKTYKVFNRWPKGLTFSSQSFPYPGQLRFLFTISIHLCSVLGYQFLCLLQLLLPFIFCWSFLERLWYCSLNSLWHWLQYFYLSLSISVKPFKKNSSPGLHPFFPKSEVEMDCLEIRVGSLGRETSTYTSFSFPVTWELDPRNSSG